MCLIVPRMTQITLADDYHVCLDQIITCRNCPALLNLEFQLLKATGSLIKRDTVHIWLCRPWWPLSMHSRPDRQINTFLSPALRVCSQDTLPEYRNLQTIITDSKTSSTAATGADSCPGLINRTKIRSRFYCLIALLKPSMKTSITAHNLVHPKNRPMLIGILYVHNTTSLDFVLPRRISIDCG
jgi:hypothetical protein